MVDRPEISNAEWQVMNVVWNSEPVTASEVIRQLAKPNRWTPATIRTFLHRLVKKGALTYETEGNRYLYCASITKAAMIKQAGKAFSSSVFGGEVGALLTHFVKSSKLTEEEIQELRALLQQKEPKQ